MGYAMQRRIQGNEGWCDRCGYVPVHRSPLGGTEHLGFLAFTIVSCGFLAPLWIAHAVRGHLWRCAGCRRRVRVVGTRRVQALLRARSARGAQVDLPPERRLPTPVRNAVGGRVLP